MRLRHQTKPSSKATTAQLQPHLLISFSFKQFNSNSRRDQFNWYTWQLFLTTINYCNQASCHDCSLEIKHREHYSLQGLQDAERKVESHLLAWALVSPYRHLASVQRKMKHCAPKTLHEKQCCEWHWEINYFKTNSAIKRLNWPFLLMHFTVLILNDSLVYIIFLTL